MSDTNMRDELLALQHLDPQIEAEFERRIHEMRNVELTSGQRMTWAVGALAGIVLSVKSAYVAMHIVNTMPRLTTIGYSLFALFGLGWTIVAGSIALRGKLARDRDPGRAIDWAFGFVVLQFGVFLAHTRTVHDKYGGTWMMFLALGWLVVGTAFYVMVQIQRSFLKTEEESLRLRLDIAELSDKLEKKS